MGGEREKRKKDRNKRERKKERKRFKKPDRNVSFQKEPDTQHNAQKIIFSSLETLIFPW